MILITQPTAQIDQFFKKPERHLTDAFAEREDQRFAEAVHEDEPRSLEQGI